ncbi:MAG: hypothetical protein Q9217_004908 [Psora testacea]
MALPQSFQNGSPSVAHVISTQQAPGGNATEKYSNGASSFKIPNTNLSVSVLFPLPKFTFSEKALEVCLKSFAWDLSTHPPSLLLDHPQSDTCESIFLVLKPLIGIHGEFINFKEAISVVETLMTFITEYQYFRSMHLLIFRSDAVIGAMDIMKNPWFASIVPGKMDNFETQ